MTEQQQELIDEIMDNFDFARVAEVMKILKWKWATIGGVPDVFEIRSSARKLLKGSLKTGLNATGGLWATYRNGELRLAFEVTHWDAHVDDKGNVVCG